MYRWASYDSVGGMVSDYVPWARSLRSRLPECACLLSDVLKLVGKRGVYDVLSFLKKKKDKGKEKGARFCEISEETNLPCQATLSDALKLLHTGGFIERNIKNEPGSSLVARYVITKIGEDLFKKMDELNALEGKLIPNSSGKGNM